MTKREKEAFNGYFSGSRAKWLPLYRRLIARLSAIPGLEVHAGKSALAIRDSRGGKTQIARIRVARQGLEIGLSLKKAALKSTRLKAPTATTPKSITHRVVISEAGEIDSELLTWIQAARVGNARRRST